MLLRPVVVLLLGLTACQREPAPLPTAAKPEAVERQPAAPAPMTAQQAYDAKQFAQCATLYTAEAEKGGRQRELNYYNAACCYALDGKVDAAFAALDLGLKGGLNDTHIGVDEDLASLRTDPRWPAVWKAVLAAHD